MDGRTRRGLTQGAALNSHTSNTPTLTVDVLPAAHTRTGTHTHTHAHTRVHKQIVACAMLTLIPQTNTH